MVFCTHYLAPSQLYSFRAIILERFGNGSFQHKKKMAWYLVKKWIKVASLVAVQLEI